MNVDQAATAQEFLDETAELRGADPIGCNVLGTIAASVVGGRQYSGCFWWLVRDEHQRVVGAALRTPPNRLLLAPMPDAAAVALGRAVAQADPDLPGINGPSAAVAACYAGLGHGFRCLPRMREHVYLLREYRAPEWPAGSARSATRSDTELLVRWNEAFGVDAGVVPQDWAASVEYRMNYGGWVLWTGPDGEPLALAGHSEPIGAPGRRVTRIGPVYTPAEVRGRGYGTAATAALIERLLPTGTQLMLFADIDNPASNAVYRRLGFEVVGELVETSAERWPS